MELLLPKEVLRWIDANRENRSRQAYIANCLRDLMNDEITTSRKPITRNDKINYPVSTPRHGDKD